MKSVKQIKKFENKPLQIFRVPKEGDSVYMGQRPNAFPLREQLDIVNDGIIYSAGNGICAKIFNREKLDTYHKNKCIYMTSHKIVDESICWPVQILSNEKGEFVGYLFRPYKGYALDYAVFKKAGLDTVFPRWEKKDVVELAITILDKIEILHKNGVLLGCLDPSSIKIVNSKTVYFTNTDQYQVNDYLCLLRNQFFIPPERIDYMDKNFLFSNRTENYLLAVLIFLILMTGKAPYVTRNGQKGVESIKNMQFPYAYKEHHSKGVPDGVWRFMWSHLYFKLKEAFYETFQAGESRNQPADRYDEDFWLSCLKEYHQKLMSGEYCRHDKNSALLFPETFRKVKNEKYIKCVNCNKEFPVWFMDRELGNICKSCCEKISEEYFVCVDCGRKFYYSVKEKMCHITYNWNEQKHCPECKRKTVCKKCGKEYEAYKLKNGCCKECNKGNVYDIIRCKSCGRNFEFYYSEKDFYDEMNYEYPQKCKECRKKKR